MYAYLYNPHGGRLSFHAFTSKSKAVASAMENIKYSIPNEPSFLDKNPTPELLLAKQILEEQEKEKDKDCDKVIEAWENYLSSVGRPSLIHKVEKIHIINPNE